ncbi:mitochondrial ribosomal protein subunit S41 [Schizosaccharomyces osmophilus]|uniref:Small ribosomal subunit protein mS41 n=1 Tax=Schizosaccharomyces osmophilus TaxID=2545709 RepID=A0AAE9WAK1_9SCHI|nr:mitochondrial ribosomal protein subunit S41 [Schizosaccharomyces osmophilus]WBW72746.1 mitochondrial ribosomal protein subunit S41 [Schizosaccharomyces osmophilus]
MNTGRSLLKLPNGFNFFRVACRQASSVPSTRDGITDLKTFLQRIGRNTEQKIDGKITNWEELFTKSTRDMKEDGLDVRTRKYIANQRNRYIQGYNIVPYPTMKKKKGGERRS